VIHFNTELCFLICFLIQSPQDFLHGDNRVVLSTVVKDEDQQEEDAIVESTYESQKKSIENVDSIVFSGDITNEEAYILQLLKEKQNKCLICPEVKDYQDFLKAYSSSSGHHIFNGDIDRLKASDIVISFGVWFEDKSLVSIPYIQKIVQEKTTGFIYMHPIEDVSFQGSITQFIKYEVGTEEGVAALLAYTLLEERDVPQEIEEILEELDIGYLSAECNVGEEELEAVYGLIDDNTSISIMIGNDLYAHPKADQIAKLVALLERYAGVNVICLPPSKNALGIALICELDEITEGNRVIYKSTHEGTYLNENKCVYVDEGMQLSQVERLNNIGDSVGVNGQNIIDFSNRLPHDRGFQTVTSSDFKERCIYKLTPKAVKEEFILEEIDDLPEYDGALIYTYQVEELTEEEEDILSGSKQFAMATKLQDGDLITYEINGAEFKRVFKIDTHMKGVIALNPICHKNLSAYLVSSYRFSRLAFEKINNQNIGNNDE
jgi:NADH-quinone oxidoreductase subunit G